MVGKALVVDVQDHPDGGVKIYLSPRSEGVYVIVDDPMIAERMRGEWANAWTGHLLIDRPPDSALHYDPTE